MADTFPFLYFAYWMLYDTYIFYKTY